MLHGLNLSGTSANVQGDSRAVLARGGKAVPLTRDHKPDDLEEEVGSPTWHHANAPMLTACQQLNLQLPVICLPAGSNQEGWWLHYHTLWRAPGHGLPQHDPCHW